MIKLVTGVNERTGGSHLWNACNPWHRQFVQRNTEHTLYTESPSVITTTASLRLLRDQSQNLETNKNRFSIEK